MSPKVSFTAKLLLLVAAIASCQTVAEASDRNTSNFRIPVKVSINANDDIRPLVESYLKRELRALGDVEVVDEEPQFHISVIALALTTVGGDKTGIALSVVTLEPFTNQFLSHLVHQENRAALLEMTSGLYLRPSQTLRVGGSDSLQSLCQAAIAEFDSQVLEQRRKLYRMIRKAVEK